VFEDIDQHLLSKQTVEKALRPLRELMPSVAEDITVPDAPYFPDLSNLLETGGIWDPQIKPDMLSFHFGIPPKEIISEARNCDITVGITATCLEDAHLAAESGADIVILQGIEAGGHRGTYSASSSSEQDDQELTAIELLKRVKKSLPKLPVISAGGIMNGTDIARFLHSGANAVQMGTAFMTTRECGIPACYKQRLLPRSLTNSSNDVNKSTMITKCFSGRRARCIPNEFVTRMECAEVLPFPIQNTVTQHIRQVAKRFENVEYMSLYAGANYHQNKFEINMPVKELMKRLVDEIHQWKPHI